MRRLVFGLFVGASLLGCFEQNEGPGSEPPPISDACDLLPEFEPPSSVRPRATDLDFSPDTSLDEFDPFKAELPLCDPGAAFPVGQPCNCRSYNSSGPQVCDVVIPAHCSCPEDDTVCLEVLGGICLPGDRDCVEPCFEETTVCSVPTEFPEGVYDPMETWLTEQDIGNKDNVGITSGSIKGCYNFVRYAWPDCSLVAEASGTIASRVNGVRTEGTG
jgi:hypothetical protein